MKCFGSSAFNFCEPSNIHVLTLCSNTIGGSNHILTLCSNTIGGSNHIAILYSNTMGGGNHINFFVYINSEIIEH